MGSQVSRPLQIVLVVVVLLAAVWMVALRPKSASTSSGSTPAAADSSAATTTPTTPAGPTAPGVKGLSNAVQQAHGAVKTSQTDADKLNRASAQAGAPNPAKSGSSSSSASGAATAAQATTSKSAKTHATKSDHGKAATHHAKMLQARPPVILPRGRGPKVADRTLAQHHVLALLFYNPQAADDRAVLAAFSHLSRHGGKVTAVAAPLRHLADFTSIATKVAVTGSPTFVVFDRQGTPTKLVGFSDPALMDQRVADALAGH